MKRTKRVSEGKPKKLGIILLSSGIALLLAVAVAFNILALVVFDNILTQALGSGEPGTVGETHGADTEYYKSAFKNAKELSDYEMALCAEMAQEGATILLAGKGHETYQILGKVKHHFDEREIVEEIFTEMKTLNNINSSDRR